MEIKIRNKFTRPSGAESNYENLEDGLHLMGLCAVKECVKKNNFTNEEYEAYRLVFRSKDNPNAFINYTQKISVHERSNMFKALVCMSGGKLKKLKDAPGADPDEAFRLLMGCVGKWFNVMVSRNEKGDAVYNNVVNNSIIPAPNANDEYGDCLKWFEKHQAKAPAKQEVDDLPTGFESFPDKGKVEDDDDDILF